MTRNAVILGATSGIGKESALWLAARGWRVGVAGRRVNLLEELAAGNPEAYEPAFLDLDDADSVPGVLERMAERLGDVELFFISSGTGFLNPDLDPGPELATVATNVAGFTRAADWAYGYLKRRGGGGLAAITSVAGLLGAAEAPAYSASKAYQTVYLDGLRKRARKEAPGLAVTEIRPGSVRTDMMKGEGHFWISEPQAAADLACRAILKRKRLQYVSRRWALIGAALRLAALFG